MTWTLRTGDRIRLKTRTVFGFKGIAIVLRDTSSSPDGLVAWRPEGSSDHSFIGHAIRCEVAKCRIQYPLRQQLEARS